MSNELLTPKTPAIPPAAVPERARENAAESDALAQDLDRLEEVERIERDRRREEELRRAQELARFD